MYNFKFIKPYYPEVEILVLFSLSRSTLQRYREECLKNGGDLFLDMGYFHIKGIKSAMYEPIKFSAWLFDHRVTAENKYDYEIAEVNKVKEGLINLASQSVTQLKQTKQTKEN